MLIFGYGPRAPKDRGPAAPRRCPNCGNQAWYHLVTQRHAFSLFFIPLLPLKTQDTLVCQVCRASVPLTRTQAARAADMVTETDRFRRGRLSDVEYGMQVDAFWASLGEDVGAAPPSVLHSPPPGEDVLPPAPPDPILVPPTGHDGPSRNRGRDGGSAIAMPAPFDPFSPGTAPRSSAEPPTPATGVPTDSPTEPPSAPPPDAARRHPDPPPGWYDDPFSEKGERYWDGSRWTRASR